MTCCDEAFPAQEVQATEPAPQALNCRVVRDQYECDARIGTYTVAVPRDLYGLIFVNRSIRDAQVTSIKAHRPDMVRNQFLGEFCANLDDNNTYCPEAFSKPASGAACARTDTNPNGLARPSQPALVNPYAGEVGCARKYSYATDFEELRWGSAASGIGVALAIGARISMGGAIFAVQGAKAYKVNQNFTYTIKIEPAVKPAFPLRIPQADLDLACTPSGTYYRETRKNNSRNTWRVVSAAIYGGTGIGTESLDGAVRVSIRNAKTGAVLKGWYEKAGSKVDPETGMKLPIILSKGGYADVEPGAAVEIPPGHEIEVTVLNRCAPTAGRWGYATWLNYIEQ